MNYDQKKYRAAVNALAEQIAAMAQEDGVDDDHVRHLIEDYTADAVYDINIKAKELTS